MSIESINQLKTKIEEYQKDIQLLEAKIAADALESPDKKLAVVLHDLLCRGNHTDQCGWHYEQDSTKSSRWDHYDNARYLKKAQSVICMCEQSTIQVDTAIAICKMLRDT